MRKLSLFLLLASSAMPALAQRGEDGDRQSRRSDQSESRAERSERPQRAERSERSERREQREQPQVQVERQVRTEASRGERMQRYQQQVQQQQGDGSRSERIQRYQQQVEQQQAQGQSSRAERMEQWRRRQVDANTPGRELVQRDRRVRPIPVLQPEVGQAGPVRTDVRRIGRDGRYERDGHRDYRDGRRHRDDRYVWAGNWRNDRRYDWRRYRDRNRSIFSLGFYFDPFGFSYRRFGIGSYLYPGYYQSSYWINDPWQYRLPPAYGPYRWVRYHNDAVMIDTWTGEVVDVIYGFFW